MFLGVLFCCCLGFWWVWGLLVGSLVFWRGCWWVLFSFQGFLFFISFGGLGGFWGLFAPYLWERRLDAVENTEYIYSYGNKYALTISMKHERILMH